jgi:hypothetical protein
MNEVTISEDIDCGGTLCKHDIDGTIDAFMADERHSNCG